MDIVRHDTSSGDAMDVIAADSFVQPMPAPLAEEGDQDEVDRMLEDAVGVPVVSGGMVENSMPLGKQRVSPAHGSYDTPA